MGLRSIPGLIMTVHDRSSDRGSQPVMAELSSQVQHRDNGAGTVLFAVPRAQPVPELVIAGRPTSSLPPLRQGLRSCHRTRLVAQHIKVMLKIQHMLAAPMTTLLFEWGSKILFFNSAKQHHSSLQIVSKRERSTTI